ncbi:MAG: TetR/AcrR family transcriptional regulator [Novosphingobium sp.]|nr:TetR/AcrR family transcriptional regulator [Novosphingobium sp.]
MVSTAQNGPRVAPPRPTVEEDRARLIVSAADELICEGGLEGLTIRAVLARTGLARRAFYESFSGKDDLVLAVFEATLQEAADHFGAVARDLGDPVEGLRAVLEGIVLGRFDLDVDPGEVVDRRAAALSREHLRLAETRPGELQAALSPLLELIAEQVRSGITTGQVRKECDPSQMARLIYNLVATTTHTELIAEEQTGPDRAKRQALAGTLWEFCRRAIIA